MSKSLVKLVDEAILPAFVLVGLKVVGIAIVNNLLSLSFYYQNFGKIFYATQLNVVTVNSASDMIVFGGVFLVCLFLIAKLLFFTDDKAKPSILLKLAKADKVGFIQTSIELYHVLFVWMLFLTGVVIYIIIRSIYLLDYPVILAPSVALYLILLWIVIKEIERDIIRKLDIGKRVLV